MIMDFNYMEDTDRTQYEKKPSRWEKGSPAYIPVGLWIAAALFLFNPNFHVIDLLPDSIGCILMAIGFSYLPDCVPQVAKARGWFVRWGIFALIPWIGLVLLFTVEALQEQIYLVTTLVLVSDIISLGFGITAFSALFGALDSVGYLCQPEVPAYMKDREGRQTEKLRRFTLFFFIFRSIIGFLPELVTLDMDRISVMYQFINLIRWMAILPELILGIVWAVRIIRFELRIFRDPILTGGLTRIYDEKIRNVTGYLIRHRMWMLMVCWTAGVILSFDLFIDNKALIPNFLSPLAFLAGVILCSSCVKNWKRAAWACGAAALSGTVYYLLQVFMMQKYDITRLSFLVVNYEDVYGFLIPVRIVALLDAAVYLWMIFECGRFLFEFIQLHTGFDLINRELNRNQNRRDLQKGLRTGFMICGILLAVYTVVCALDYFFFQYIFFYWILALIFGAIVAWVFSDRLRNLYTEVIMKYEIDLKAAYFVPVREKVRKKAEEKGLAF